MPSGAQELQFTNQIGNQGYTKFNPVKGTCKIRDDEILKIDVFVAFIHAFGTV